MKEQVKVYFNIRSKIPALLVSLVCFVLVGHCRARRTLYAIIYMWLTSRASHIAWWIVVTKNRLAWERLFHMHWNFTRSSHNTYRYDYCCMLLFKTRRLHSLTSELLGICYWFLLVLLEITYWVIIRQNSTHKLLCSCVKPHSTWLGQMGKKTTIIYGSLWNPWWPWHLRRGRSLVGSFPSQSQAFTDWTVI